MSKKKTYKCIANISIPASEMEKVCQVFMEYKSRLMGMLFEGGIKFSELDALEQFYAVKEAIEFGVEDFIKVNTPVDKPDPYDSDEITQLKRYESAS